MTRRLLTLTALITLATRPAVGQEPVDPRNPPQGRFSDDWAEVYLAGGKVGYAHTTMTRKGDLIHTGNEVRMSIGRADQPVKVATIQSTVESLDGRPLTFDFEMDLSVTKTAIRGRIEQGKVTVVSTQYGIDQTQVFDFPAGALMAWGMYREVQLRGYQPGTSYDLQVYAPDLRLDAAVTAKTVVGNMDSFQHQGKTIPGQRVTTTLETHMGAMEMVSWVDRGRVLKATIPAPGLGHMELITTDQATALADFIPPELFMSSIIKADRKLLPEKTQRITYLLRTKTKTATLAELPATGMQTPTPQPDGSVRLVVSRQQPPNDNTPPRAKLSRETLSEYLDGNLMINTRDPMLIKLAQQAGNGEKNPYKLAGRLTRFVSDYVAEKNLNIGFATASEVCRTREGDCSEHGVLLAALGRLNNLPSRVVVGLAYVPAFGGRNDIFGYHLWTQFYIDGTWFDFDAALRETNCSPTRIAFATSSLKNSGLADLSLPLINKIGAIDIDILSVEPNPHAP